MDKYNIFNGIKAKKHIERLPFNIDPCEAHQTHKEIVLKYITDKKYYEEYVPNKHKRSFHK
jgi:hypothetical protein